MSTFKKDLVDKYVLLVMEFIHSTHTSDVVKSIDDPSIVINGLKCLIHVFKLALHITNNIDSAVAYTQKGSCCYLEYVEQMHKTQYILNVNISDAIMFVYSKTIGEIYAPHSSNQTSSISNCISLSDDSETETEEQRLWLRHLEETTFALLWFENPQINNIQRIDLSHLFLQKYFQLIVATEIAEPGSDVLGVLNAAQSIQPDYIEYVEFLNEFQKQLKKKNKYATQPIRPIIRSNILYFHANYRECSFEQIAQAECLKSKPELAKWFLEQ